MDNEPPCKSVPPPCPAMQPPSRIPILFIAPPGPLPPLNLLPPSKSPPVARNIITASYCRRPRQHPPPLLPPPSQVACTAEEEKCYYDGLATPHSCVNGLFSSWHLFLETDFWKKCGFFFGRILQLYCSSRWSGQLWIAQYLCLRIVFVSADETDNECFLTFYNRATTRKTHALSFATSNWVGGGGTALLTFLVPHRKSCKQETRVGRPPSSQNEAQ